MSGGFIDRDEYEVVACAWCAFDFTHPAACTTMVESGHVHIHLTCESCEKLTAIVVSNRKGQTIVRSEKVLA